MGSDEKQIISVFNKIDLLDSKQRNDIKFNTGIGSYYVSTKTGEGINSATHLYELYEKHSIKYPEFMDEESISFIEGCLKFDKNKRFCFQEF